MTDVQKQNCTKICMLMNEKFLECNEDIPQNKPIRLVDKEQGK